MSATIQSAGCPAPAQDNKLLLWQRFIKGRGISYIVLAVIGIINAANGRAKELPVIGKIKLLK